MQSFFVLPGTASALFLYDFSLNLVSVIRVNQAAYVIEECYSFPSVVSLTRLFTSLLLFL